MLLYIAFYGCYLFTRAIRQHRMISLLDITTHLVTSQNITEHIKWKQKQQNSYREKTYIKLKFFSKDSKK